MSLDLALSLAIVFLALASLAARLLAFRARSPFACGCKECPGANRFNPNSKVRNPKSEIRMFQ